MTRTIIVYGPPACGKTRNALKIAKHFGVHQIVDDWDPGRHHLRRGALHLTHNCPDVVRAECYAFKNLRFGNVESGTARRVAPVFRKIYEGGPGGQDQNGGAA